VVTAARIYGPTKSAMRSIARTKSWVLDFEQASPKRIEPLMGWTASADVRQQVRMLLRMKPSPTASRTGSLIGCLSLRCQSAWSKPTRTTSPTPLASSGRIRSQRFTRAMRPLAERGSKPSARAQDFRCTTIIVARQR
jgi:hypothetical protein